MSDGVDEKLAAALAYRNADVIDRFLKLYDVPRAEAEELFVETLKWMCLLSRHGDARIYPEMVMLDEMWHNFILFTYDYAAYCDQHLEEFLHHQPSTSATADEAKERDAEDPDGAKSAYLEAYEDQLEETASLFGEETVIRWHVEYRNRYSAEFFAAHRRPPSTLHSLSSAQLESLLAE